MGAVSLRFSPEYPFSRGTCVFQKIFWSGGGAFAQPPPPFALLWMPRCTFFAVALTFLVCFLNLEFCLRLTKGETPFTFRCWSCLSWLSRQKFIPQQCSVAKQKTTCHEIKDEKATPTHKANGGDREIATKQRTFWDVRFLKRHFQARALLPNWPTHFFPFLQNFSTDEIKRWRKKKNRIWILHVTAQPTAGQETTLETVDNFATAEPADNKSETCGIASQVKLLLTTREVVIEIQSSQTWCLGSGKKNHCRRKPRKKRSQTLREHVFNFCFKKSLVLLVGVESFVGARLWSDASYPIPCLPLKTAKRIDGQHFISAATRRSRNHVI